MYLFSFSCYMCKNERRFLQCNSHYVSHELGIYRHINTDLYTIKSISMKENKHTYVPKRASISSSSACETSSFSTVTFMSPSATATSTGPSCWFPSCLGIVGVFSCSSSNSQKHLKIIGYSSPYTKVNKHLTYSAKKN